jgi:hypothetical protein
MKDIKYAIRYLPEEYFTQEIVDAAISQGDVEVLNYLPAQCLTSENILALIEKDAKSWRSFNLEKIPVHFRTEKVCLSAVKSNCMNYLYVPALMKTQEITDEVIGGMSHHMQLLEAVPCEVWNEENTHKVLSSIYLKSGYVYRYPQLPYALNHFRQLQVFLAYVPAKIKNRRFYFGLFSDTAIPAEHLDSIIPAKYKNDLYYRLLAQKDIMVVPENRYSHRLFLEAMKAKNQYAIYRMLETESVKQQFFDCMDDELADATVVRRPQFFNVLPVRFQTAERLLFIISNNPDTYNYDQLINDAKGENLLTKAVCEALVKSGKKLPVFPDEIWDTDFVAYCQANSSFSFYWFEQMPQRFQTQEMVNRVLENGYYYIRYVHPSFLNSHLAMQLYRENEQMKKYLPEKFFADFTAMTSLPEEFFGGEVTFMKLKDEKQRYTYCRIGNSFIGFYSYHKHRDTADSVIMTRASSKDTQPEIIFDRRVRSFHKTWLEKQIADYDHDFVKPVVGKRLKDVQLSSYYGVEPAGTKEDIQLYRNTFRGETVAYVAKRGEMLFSGDTREEVISHCKENTVTQ